MTAPPKHIYRCDHCDTTVGLDVNPTAPPTHTCKPRAGKPYPLKEVTG